jgi:hypothetical protein
MDVFLVPVALDRHELYCEHEHVEPLKASADPAARTIRQRVTDTFRRAVKEGEEARRGGPDAHQVPKGRVRRWITTRLAEAVAEQRLLWHLRTAEDAELIYPDDLPESRARDLSRHALQSDLQKHRRWCAIDTALAIVCAPLTLFPGPNLPAYYFVFRAAGHFLSMRGAQVGLNRLVWRYVPSAPLATLRTVDTLEPDARAARVEEIGLALGLAHLGPFVEGASRPS